MCRIAGIVDRGNNNIGNDIVAMRDSMAHGGPDSAGVYINEARAIALGHRRLSLIDLSDAGSQPMHSADGRLVIVFNGEIYNYLELKKELETLGQVFTTHTDTEVIIAAYRQWGIDSFKKLKGMFAFALYNTAKDELLLVRDQQGIKPLYYYIDNDKLYFASEIRAFKTLGRWPERSDWKIYFLTYGYLPEPVTTLQGVKPLPKGTCLVVNVQTLGAKPVVFDETNYEAKITDLPTAIEAVRETLTLAVRRHMISDAPIGLFLSGGIDSSLLTLIAHQSGHKDLHTLSIVFEEEDFSEAPYQNIIAKKTGAHHKPFTLTKEQFVAAMPDILKAMDQPTADGVNTYFICGYAKQYGLKAVLSGLGADELFGGYASFNREDMIASMQKIPAPVLKMASYLPQDKYRKVSFLSRKDAVGEYLFHRGFFHTGETARILNADMRQVSEALQEVHTPAFVDALPYGNKVSYLESNLYMQCQLLRDTDMMSMWHSIEVRVPYLDTDLVNLANSIAPSVKFNSKQIKHLLIESFADILPEEIWNRKKQGFVFPFQRWMEGNENKSFKKADARISARYKSGKLNWSRYWAYLIANNYEVA